MYTHTHTHIKCVLYVCINTYSQTAVFTLCLYRALGLCETQEQNPCADWFPSQEQFLVIDSEKGIFFVHCLILSIEKTQNLGFGWFLCFFS